jgi:hypothetical protein
MPLQQLIKQWLRQDAADAIDLIPGEEILHVTGRHWMLLLSRLILPLLGIVFFGGLVFYRSIGGGFLVVNTGEPTGFDLWNIFLIVVEVVLLLFWLALWVRRSKDWKSRNALLIASALILLVIYFRYGGGRLLYLEPEMASTRALDIFNIVLIGGALFSTVGIFITFYDWLNDELILTSRRVVYDNDEVWLPGIIERRVQEQIYIEDVQNVLTSTKTYPQHWLGYGTIVVKSARLGGQLLFESASNPRDMQKNIMDKVTAFRKQRSNEEFQQMIEARVYDNKVQQAPRKIEIKRTHAMRALTWLFPDNPEINESSHTVTWRPHWLFMLRALIGPFLLLAFGIVAVVVLGGALLITPFWLITTMVLVVIVFLLWAAWEVEDYRNDLYILGGQSVIDIEKKPFGPEERRSASLGQITNVSFETTFVSNLLGYGNVLLETAGGGGRFTFERVPRPRDVVTLINDYQAEFKRGEKERALNDTLMLLRHYHEAQQRHNELNVPPS